MALQDFKFNLLFMKYFSFLSLKKILHYFKIFYTVSNFKNIDIY